MGTLQRNIVRLFADAIKSLPFRAIGRSADLCIAPKEIFKQGGSKTNNKSGPGQKWDFVTLGSVKGTGHFRNRTTGKTELKQISNVGGEEGRKFSHFASLYFGTNL